MGNRPPAVDFVARDLRARRRAERPAGQHARADSRRRLVTRERGDNREQTEPRHAPRVRFDVLGIVQTLAEHLIAAADADDRAAVGGGARDRGVQTALAQPREIGHGRLAAGKHDDVRAIDRLGVCDEAYGHARLGGQRLEIVEVRDARQAGHGHAQPRAGHVARNALEPQRVLFR